MWRSEPTEAIRRDGTAMAQCPTKNRGGMSGRVEWTDMDRYGLACIYNIHYIYIDCIYMCIWIKTYIWFILIYLIFQKYLGESRRQSPVQRIFMWTEGVWMKVALGNQTLPAGHSPVNGYNYRFYTIENIPKIYVGFNGKIRERNMEVLVQVDGKWLKYLRFVNCSKTF